MFFYSNFIVCIKVIILIIFGGGIELEINNGVFVLVNEILFFNFKIYLLCCNIFCYILKLRYVYDICKIKLIKVRILLYM